MKEIAYWGKKKIKLWKDKGMGKKLKKMKKLNYLKRLIKLLWKN